MLEQELFAFLERTSDGAFADTEHGENSFLERAGQRSSDTPASELLDPTCHEAWIAAAHRERKFALGVAVFKLARRMTSWDS